MANKDKNTPEIYVQFVGEIVNLIQTYRIQAIQTVQAVSNQLYWKIGELIIQKQKEYGWGTSVIEQLSKDLTHQIGDGVSWSPRNLRLMKQLVEEYSNMKQSASNLEKDNKNKTVDKKSNVNQLGSHLEKDNGNRGVMENQM